jgi:hypothetical protein
MSEIFNSMSRKHKNIVNYYAQHVANASETQVCMVRNDFGGIDIKPLKITLVVSNPNLVGIVSPYYDPLSNARKSGVEWMDKSDLLTLNRGVRNDGRNI